MSKLSLLDMAFFLAETTASPKHVAGLLMYKRPAGAPASFARALHREWLSQRAVKAPFDRVIRFALPGLPRWERCAEVNLAQHVFYHKLKPGQNQRPDLYAYVSALHEPVLDRGKPLWEVHIVDGLRGGRFAVYKKLHHALADGVTMARWITGALATSADELETTPLWTQQQVPASSGKAATQWCLLQSLWKIAGGARKRMFGVSRLSAMLLLESMKLTKNAIALPFAASRHTPLTGQVTAGRQFATAGVPLAQVDSIRASTRSTLNHVALTCLDAALHRYLRDQGVELTRPITIQMPVSLRQEGDRSAGNKIGIVQVELSAPTDDPYVRLRNIGFSLRNVRSMIDSVAQEAIESYTVIAGLAGQLVETLQLSEHLPPLGNTLVSNVQGPKHRLYLKGALLEEMHPISTLPPSNLLNITLFSYAGTLHFGFIATSELPNLERLGSYVDDAFAELAQTIALAGRQAASQGAPGGTV